MHWRQESVYAAARRAQKFLDENASVLGPETKGPQRKDLNRAVGGFMASAAEQSLAQTQRRGRTKDKNKLRKALFDDHLRPIAHIARKRLGDTKEIFNMRVPGKRTSDTMLVMKARAMAKGAGGHRRVFLGQQMPLDFVEHCREAAQEFYDAVGAREMAVARLVKSTEDIASHTALIRDAMRVINTSVVKYLHKKHVELLGQWNQARRYGQKPGPKQVKARKGEAKKKAGG